jgi:hypothetical protein
MIAVSAGLVAIRATGAAETAIMRPESCLGEIEQVPVQLLGVTPRGWP